MKTTNTNKRLIASALIAATLAAPLSVAFAGDAEARDRGYRGHGNQHRYDGHRGHRGHRGHDNAGAYIGLGLGALALGSVLALTATQPSYAAPPAYYAPPPPPPAYYAPAPSYYAPPATYYAPPSYDPYYNYNGYTPDPQFDRNTR